MEHRDVNLTAAGISPFAYRELLYFCRQYDEKRRKLRGTLDEGVRKRLMQDIADIEQCVKEADRACACALINNVARGVPFDLCRPACGRRQFFDARKRFLTELSLRRSDREEAVLALLGQVRPEKDLFCKGGEADGCRNRS